MRRIDDACGGNPLEKKAAVEALQQVTDDFDSRGLDVFSGGLFSVGGRRGEARRKGGRRGGGEGGRREGGRGGLGGTSEREEGDVPVVERNELGIRAPTKQGVGVAFLEEEHQRECLPGKAQMLPQLW